MSSGQAVAVLPPTAAILRAPVIDKDRTANSTWTPVQAQVDRASTALEISIAEWDDEDREFV